MAGNADPETGYQIEINGQQIVNGGTSTVALLWTGLMQIPISNEVTESVLSIHFCISYRIQTGIFYDIRIGKDNISNENRAYKASSGWDACTG
ncbi:hypothetical protein PDL68_23315 [Bacillus cereus]|nr:hypothetical protein [Bacillus cereus]